MDPSQKDDGCRPSSVLLETPFVGRQEEFARAVALLSKVAEPDNACGRVLFIAGEPGIGKSRLAHELVARARAVGFEYLVGRCVEHYAGVPFAPFAEAISSAFSAQPPKTRAGLRKQWPELLTIMPDEHAILRKDNEQAQLRTYRAVEALIRLAAATRPLVVLVEDLHWADNSSLDLLLHLGRHLEGQRLLLICTCRDTELDAQHRLDSVIHDLRSQRVVDHLSLGPLSPDGTATLTRVWLGMEQAPADFLSYVHQSAMGNPLFIEELLRAFHEQGVLGTAPDAWTRGASNVDVPRSVRALVRQRVERLPTLTQSVLRVASSLGEEFDVELVGAVAGSPEVDVLDALEAALAARILRRQRLPVGQRWSFAHALVKQAVYEQLPARAVRDLHRRALGALEVFRGEHGEWAAELARHALAAGDARRARELSDLAGDHAASLNAHAEAAFHYVTALNILAEAHEDALAAEVRSKLAAELNYLDRPSDAIAEYQVAFRTYAAFSDLVHQSRVQRAIGWVHQYRFDFRSAIPYVDAAVALWPAERQDPELTRLLLDAVRTRVFTADFETAAALLDRGWKLTRQLEDLALEATAAVESAVLHCYQGVPQSKVLTELDRAEVLARRVRDPLLATRTHTNRGAGPRWRLGDLEGFRADVLQALEIAEKSSWATLISRTCNFVAKACLFLGDWRAGREAGLRSRSLCEQFPSIKAHVYAEALAWMEGDFDGALRILRESLAEGRRRADMTTVMHSLFGLAELALQLGRPRDAIVPAREAVDIVRRQGYWGESHTSFVPLAEALARAAAPDARVILEEASELVERHELVVARPQLARARALLLEHASDRAAAIRELVQSAEVARGQGAQPEVGRTLADLARVARSVGNRSLAEQAETELAEIVQRIGPEVRGLEWAAGVSRTGVAPTDSSTSVGKLPIPLTRREAEVARLVAQGLSNRQIAEALLIAEGTAGVHVDHMLTKLGFHSRTQLALWALEHGLHSRATD
jgi:DNA-binding CsgD family transcriptional regulator